MVHKSLFKSSMSVSLSFFPIQNLTKDLFASCKSMAIVGCDVVLKDTYPFESVIQLRATSHTS